MDEMLLNKKAIIERCLLRIQEEYAGDDNNLLNNFTKQDSIILNLQRACEAAIDLAMHVVRVKKLGIPQESRDAFMLLAAQGILEQTLAERLGAMVGFRNVAIHDYRKLNLEIVRGILVDRLEEFRKFTRVMTEVL